MDSGNTSCSKTRSGLVRANSIMDLSNDSCSRTRSGLVRRKNFMGSSDDSCSRTRSGLVRRKGFTKSSDDSCSRTRSGLVRRKSFMDSSDGSCSRTQNGLLKGSPSVKALTMDGPVRKGLPDADGHVIEETPSRTRSGLVRQSPIVKREDMPVATQSGLVRANPAIKTVRDDEPVIKGLADGWLKEDRPLGTRSGLIRGSLPVKDSRKVESVTKGQHDSGLREGKSIEVEVQSGIVQGSNVAKTLGEDESVTKGLPDGWRKEYRPRKPGSEKHDLYFIDPVSGYEFRSLKDVYRYRRTGDIRYCVVRPKKGTLYDVCITENQFHTSSSSEQTRPGTADKGIQCEILTSEGIMLPWEELFTPQRGENTEHTMSPESESMKALKKDDDRLEALQQNGVKPFTAQHAPRETESIKIKDQNVEVKSKKRRSEASPAVTPLGGSRRLAALVDQSEGSIEPEDQSITSNLVNQLQTGETNNNSQSEMVLSSTKNKIHGNDERTFDQLWPSQEVSVNRMQAMQQNTTNHLQLNQVDDVNRIQMNPENTDHHLWSCLQDTDIRMRAVHGYAGDQSSQAETMNHKQTNMENTFDQLESNLADTLNHIEPNQEITAPELQLSLEDTVIPKQTMQEYCMASQEDTMNYIKMNQENTANQLQSSQADSIVSIRSTQEVIIDHSQPSGADSVNRRQVNQRNTADELQGHAGSVTQIQMMQNDMTSTSQPSQANSLNQIDMNLEDTTNHLETNYAENSLLQTGFAWASEQNGGAFVTDFWRSVENQDSSVPMQIDGVPVASFPANVKFESTSAAAEPIITTTQATIPATVSDQSGLVVPSIFGNPWSDPCIEFAFKTLTGDIPVLDDTAAVTDYFPQQQDLNKGTAHNCSVSLDNSRTHTQVDINLPLPRPSDKLHNGSWLPPQ